MSEMSEAMETPKMEDFLGGAATAVTTKVTKKTPSKKGKTPDLITATASEIENMTAQEILEQGRAIQADTDFNLFKIGGLVSVAWDKKLHIEFGYDSYEEYIRAEFATLSSSPYRKARYLRTIYENLVESQVSWESVKDIGWTKLSVLADMLTTENVKEITEMVKSNKMTVLQLQEWKKAQNESETENTPPPPKSDISTLTLKVHPDQKETIQTALDKAMSEFGTEYPAVAMDHICTGYLTGALGKAKKAKTFKEQMEAMSAEDVLAIFEVVFPNVNLSAEEVVEVNSAQEQPTAEVIPFANEDETIAELGGAEDDIVYEEEV